MLSLLFIVGILTGFTVAELNPISWFKDLSAILVPSVAVLVAAFYGAKYAFKFQSIERNEREKNRNQEYGRKAIFKLDEMINHLCTYEKQILDPVKANHAIPEGHYFMAIMPTGIQSMQVDCDPYDLMFLSKKDAVEIVSKYSVIRARYISILENISLRNEIHKSSQSTLSKLFEGTDVEVSPQHVRNVIGTSNYLILEALTQGIMKMVPALIIDISETVKEINTALKARYPEMEVVTIDITPHLERNKNK